MKTSWCAPIICLHVSRNSRSKQRLCPWTTLSSWSRMETPGVSCKVGIVFSVQCGYRTDVAWHATFIVTMMVSCPLLAVRWLLFSVGGGGGGQSNEVCQMWSGCSGSLQHTTSCSEEPQRNMWLLNWDVITFVQTFLKMKFGGRLCLCWALSVLGCVGAGALVMWKLTSILYGLDDPGILVWLPAEADIFCSQCPDPRLGPTQPFVQWIARVLHPYN
jgi:hypothetical protein